MLCKYYLHIGSEVVVVGDDNCYDVSEDVVNPQDLSQSFVRKDYGGVTRKYGSSIEFCGLAYDLLVALHRAEYLAAKASFAIYVANNNWEYELLWQCPLDFASFSYDEHKVTVSCVDNSAAALIKANGGTKSSYSVDLLKSGKQLYYDRVISQNEVKMGLYGDPISGSDETECSWDLTAFVIFCLPMIVRDSSGVSPGTQPVSLTNQSFSGYISDDSPSSYFLEATGDCRVFLDFSNVRFRVIDRESSSSLPALWRVVRSNPNVDGRTAVVYLRTTYSGPDEDLYPFKPFACDLVAGDRLSLTFVNDINEYGSPVMWPYQTVLLGVEDMVVNWDRRGEALMIDVVEPERLLNRILQTVADGKMTLVGSITPTVGGVANERLAGLVLVAAESVRGLSGAMIHSSFVEFCKFMEAEFGYVYEVEDVEIEEVSFDGFIELSDDAVVRERTSQGTNYVYFVRGTSELIRGTFVGSVAQEDGYYYTKFSDYTDYVASSGSVKTIVRLDRTFVDSTTGKKYHYDGTLDDLVEGVPASARVVFRHRTDLFSREVVKVLSPVGGLELSVLNDLLYSGVNIGYEKQDYDNGNTGRDEWNFESYYLTGVSLKEQKLELVCPYRADCYGFEELVAKREEQESTDSDEDIWLVKCDVNQSSGSWILDRSHSIVGVYSNSVFNALLAPIYMVEANRNYIASFCSVLKLSMTRGFRDIVIDGNAVTKEFTFSAAERLFNACLLKVVTDDQDLPEDLSGLVEFDWCGRVCRGYVKSVEMKCQREESLSYELIEAGG